MTENLENNHHNRDEEIQIHQNIQTPETTRTNGSSRTAFSITQTTDHQSQNQVSTQPSQEDNPPDRGRTSEQQRPPRRRPTTRYLVPLEILAHIELRGLDFRKLWPDPDQNMPQNIIDATFGFDMDLAVRLLDRSERLCDIYMSQLNVVEIAIPHYTDYADNPSLNVPSLVWRKNQCYKIFYHLMSVDSGEKTGWSWRDASIDDNNEVSPECQSLLSMMKDMKNWN
ncbi:hypothetical protein ACHAPG_002140 [Botrytis cinerea]